MTLRLCLLIVLFIAVDLVSAKPVLLSAAGRRRLQENADILKANQQDLQKALTTTRANFEVVKKELADLDQQEKEHLALKAEQKKYLDRGKDELAKNQKATKELEKWMDEHRSIPIEKLDDVAKTRLDVVRQELTDRLQWRADAEAKLAKASEVTKSIDTNLRDIRSRREPLRAQLSSLNRSRVEFESALAETSRRLIALDKQLKFQSDTAALTGSD